MLPYHTPLMLRLCLLVASTDSRSARQRTYHRQGSYRRGEEGSGAYCSAAAKVPAVAHDKDGPAAGELGAAGMHSFHRWSYYKSSKLHVCGLGIDY
jgi:hypothetical protein